ncbi:hypothetical protein E6O75_ATG03164 [Venturia nashicola]|uniref:DUF8035 domain-containing protein n=1 Tax=Venturia nashicola TaxID=86259 RepID=A0A4Z1P6Z6_9PEZI|nr:hypothetical protein E6O75_ATG03164 [Venturia nashicola]
MTVTHLNHNAREHQGHAHLHQHQNDNRGLRKVQGFSNLDCGACNSSGTTPAAILNKVVAAANLKNGMSRYQRSSSPGSRKLVVPGRSSTGTFSASYEPHSTYSRSPRDEYSTTPRSGGVIPISTEVYTNHPPPPPGSAYSGRPRVRAGSDAIPPSTRTRNVIHDSGISRPSSPLTRNYETVHVKPSTTRHEHKKMYSIDNGSAVLIAETEVVPRDHRKERGGYQSTGSGGAHSRPREIDDTSFSYTDPAGMYRDTEPRWRARRGSIDNRRPVSMTDGYQLPPPPPPPRTTREPGPPPSTRGFDKIVPLSRGGGSLRDPGRTSLRDLPARSSSRDGHRPSIPARDLPVRPASRDGHRPHTYDPYREEGPYGRAAGHRSTTVLPVLINPPRDNREDRYYQEEYKDREREAHRSRRFEDEAVASRGFGIRSGSVDRYRSNSSSAEALPRPPPPTSNPAAAIYGSEPLVKIPSVTDYAPKPVMDDRRSRPEPRLASGPPPPVMDDRRERIEPSRRNSIINDYPPPAREDGPKSRAMPREERPLPPRDDRSAPREERREPWSEPRNDYLPTPIREDRRNSVHHRDRDRDRDGQRERERGDRKEREYERPREREREREYERPIERPREREREYDEPRRDDKSRREDKGREDKAREEKTREEKTRDLAAKGVAAASVAAAGAMAGAAYQDKKHRDKKEESDEESDEERRKSRRETNDKEDDRERKHVDRDRDDRKKEKKEAVDPDEDYRRRVQQAELELTRKRSNEDDRSGSDRERRRRDRREREERERQEKERRDRPLEIQEAPPPPALRREDILPPPKETVPVAIPVRREPVPAGRGRDYAESIHSDDQHNRYDSRQGSFLNGPVLLEPEPMSREPSATAGASFTAGASSTAAPLVSTRNGGSPSETADEKEQRERRVTIVEPRKDDPTPEVPVKGILRRPTKVFPEYPNPIREGVTPLKERLEKKGASAKEIPKDAKWTKIDRKLVNPQALEEKGVRFEERLDCVIVLSVLTRDEISAFAKRTEEIRDEREERYRKDKSRSRRHHGNEEGESLSSDSEEGYRRRHERESRHEKEKERGGDRERERERGDRDRDSHRRRDYDDDYTTEEERRAVEDVKRKKRGDRAEDDSYTSGGLGR